MAVNMAFIGRGNMGSGILARLPPAGFHQRAYKRTCAKADGLVAAGAIAEDSMRDDVKNADMVVSMLADDEAVLSLALGAGFCRRDAPRRLSLVDTFAAGYT